MQPENDGAAYRMRLEVAERFREKLGHAIKACGLGADSYGMWTLIDNLGEQDQVVYWRRDGQKGFRPSAEEVSSLYREKVWCLLSSRHPCPGGGSYLKWEVLNIDRYALCWGVIEQYNPLTPVQLAGLRATRERKREEKREAAEREKYPLFAGLLGRGADDGAAVPGDA